MINSPVFPIPPAFTREDKLDIEVISAYLSHLEKNGAKYIMTTCGTSQFNLLDKFEIRKLNWLCCNSDCDIIIGLPPLSNKHLYEEINYLNSLEFLRKDRDIAIMLVYPDRYYNDDDIINFFFDTSARSDYPIFIHGLPMKDCRGGIHNYDAKLINALRNIKKIEGIKEESSTIDIAYNVCSGINKKNFNVVVAGGSQRRFLSLYPTGVNSFLAGIGSIYPKIDLYFHEHLRAWDLETAYCTLRTFENSFFDIAMSIGWHKVLHEGLRHLDFWNSFERPPFYELGNDDKRKIKDVLIDLEKFIGDLKND